MCVCGGGGMYVCMNTTLPTSNDPHTVPDHPAVNCFVFRDGDGDCVVTRYK